MTSEQALSSLADSVDRFVKLADCELDPGSAFSHVIGLMHEMTAHIADCERSGVGKAKILDTIAEARLIHGRSLFVKRLQEWPRGYPGDFETVECITSQENRTTVGKIEYYIEKSSLGCMIAQQHRNKVQRQAELILQAVYPPPPPQGARTGGY